MDDGSKHETNCQNIPTFPATKTVSFPLVMFAAVMVPAAGTAAEDSVAVSIQDRETVRQVEQETTMNQPQACWEQTVRTHDRNGDGRLDDGEKLAALEKVRVRNQELVRQLQGAPANPDPSASAGQAGAQRSTQEREEAQSRERDAMQAINQQRAVVQQREWLRKYDTNRDGSLGDQEFTQALTSLDRERDAIRDRLKVKAAAIDQTKDILKEQDRLRQQDREVLRTAEPVHDRLVDRDRMDASAQPRRRTRAVTHRPHPTPFA